MTSPSPGPAAFELGAADALWSRQTPLARAQLLRLLCVTASQTELPQRHVELVFPERGQCTAALWQGLAWHLAKVGVAPLTWERPDIVCSTKDLWQELGRLREELCNNPSFTEALSLAAQICGRQAIPALGDSFGGSISQMAQESLLAQAAPSEQATPQELCFGLGVYFSAYAAAEGALSAEAGMHATGHFCPDVLVTLTCADGGGRAPLLPLAVTAMMPERTVPFCPDAPARALLAEQLQCLAQPGWFQARLRSMWLDDEQRDHILEHLFAQGMPEGGCEPQCDEPILLSYKDSCPA